MKRLFIPKYLAKLADENLFNETCLAVFFPDDDEPIILPKGIKNDRMLGNSFTAPLYQQIIDWFREKHNIDIFSKRGLKKPHNSFLGIIVDYDGREYQIYPNIDRGIEEQGTYYESLNKSIEEAFKLI